MGTLPFQGSSEQYIWAILFFFFFSLFLALLLLSLPNIFLLKSNTFSSSIEAGFLGLLKSSSMGFSIQFFVFMLVFIVFDLEILFVVGVVVVEKTLITTIIVMFILLTFYVEYGWGKLKWLV